MIRFNENNEIIRDEEYRGILVGLQLAGDISYSMKELEGLAEAAEIEVLGVLLQSLEKPNTSTFIGKGKVEELTELVHNMEADVVIFNDELSGMQLRNLEEQLGVRVIDRTILILDIFAKRAVSREGKLQVELAQLQYRMPRLTGFGKSLSRLGGGIGTRGPGEKKLETDKRHISRRIDDIKKELEHIKDNRDVQRSKSIKSGIPTVALVGYTNSGKSALMNRLLSMTEKEERAVFEKNMLFATLDTKHRNISFDNNREFLLIDTVGFVSKLPHSLVEAFKATLEEVKYADLLLQVVDSTYDNFDFHIGVTNSVIKELGAENTDRITVYNKIDLIDEMPLDASPYDKVNISAKTGENVDVLIEKISDKIFSNRVTVQLLVPFSDGRTVSYLHEKATVLSVKHELTGTRFEVELTEEEYSRLKKYEDMKS